MFILLLILFTISSIDCDCPPLSPPLGGIFVGGRCGTRVGTVCFIQCISDGVIHKRECLADNTWTGGIILCNQYYQRCPDPIPPTNGYIVGVCIPYPGSVCTLACNPGFNLVGNSRIYCIGATGKWSSSDTKCIPIMNTTKTCPELPYPRNGARNGTCHSGSTNGSVCRFKCNPGYQLIGNSSVTCQENGMWSSPIPECRKIVPPSPPQPPTIKNEIDLNKICPGLTPPSNGHYTGPCNPGIRGRSCYYACDEGYILIGDAMLTCEFNGQWSGSVPHCERTTPNKESPERCPLPRLNISVILTQCNTKKGGKCFYRCRAGYSSDNSMARKSRRINNGKLIIEKYISCQNGQWDGNFACRGFNLLKYPLVPWYIII